jgi:hypothetical protein
MASPPNAHHERRKTPRIQLKDILYVNLEPDAGGIVLNLSEGGLLFRSATPLQQEGAIGLWFQLPNGQRLEVSAELVWMGQKRKVGGLRFTNLTDETRAQLRNLIAESSAPVGEPPVTVIPSPEPPTARPVPTMPSPVVLQGQEPHLQEQFLPLGHFHPGNPREYAYRNELREESLAEGGGSFFSKLIVVLIAAALIAGSGFLFYSHRREVGAAMVQLGEQFQGSSAPVQSPAEQDAKQSNAPAEPPGPPSVPPATPAVPPATENSRPSDEASQPRQPSNLPPRAEHPPNERQTNTQPERPDAVPENDDGGTDLAAAQSYLTGTGRIRNSSAAAQFLWAAVAKGSPTAELVLAELYLEGDGVAKSCEQARVLLIAASDKGNTEAAQTLSDLARRGCR